MLIVAQQLPPHRLDEFLATLPWIVIFLFLWFFLFRFMRSSKRRNEELQAAKHKVAELEQKLDRLSADLP